MSRPQLNGDDDGSGPVAVAGVGGAAAAVVVDGVVVADASPSGVRQTPQPENPQAPAPKA